MNSDAGNESQLFKNKINYTHRCRNNFQIHEWKSKTRSVYASTFERIYLGPGVYGIDLRSRAVS